MEKLISLNELIKKSKELGVNYGKADPYNRLRYYTKKRWLPNMIRKKDSEGNWISYYPEKALDILLTIENLKHNNHRNNLIENHITQLKDSDKNIISKYHYFLKKYSIIIFILITIVMCFFLVLVSYTNNGKDLSTINEQKLILE